jgi:hypothetical protein
MARRRRNPFRPPEAEAPGLELARAPGPSTSGTVAPESSDAPLPGAAPRARVDYRPPRTSWVVLVVLALAVVGGFVVVKRAMHGLRDMATAKPEPIVYLPLPPDDGVLIEIDVQPAHARVLLDGQAIPSKPLRLPRSHDAHKLSASADGYEPAVLDLTPDAPKTVRLRLTKAK